MSIYIDSGEIIFRMINWSALLVCPMHRGTYQIPISDHAFAVIDDFMLKIDTESFKFSIWFDADDSNVQIDIGKIILVLSVEGDHIEYSIDPVLGPDYPITKDEFIKTIPDELNEMCEYMMKCGIMVIR